MEFLTLTNLEVEYGFVTRYNYIWVKIRRSILKFFVCCSSVIVCSETSVCWRIFFVFSSSTQPWFSMDPSTLCSSTNLFRFLKLNLIFVVVATLQQQVMLHKHSISIHLNFLLMILGSLLSSFWCLSKHIWWKNFATLHEQWNYRCNPPIAGAPIPLSFQVGYNPPFPSGQEQDTANLCPFPSLLTCLRHRNWWKKLYYSSNNRSFAYWRTKNPIEIGSSCSICALASSTSYNALFTQSNFMKILLLRVAYVFSSLRYFVTEWRLWSIFW